MFKEYDEEDGDGQRTRRLSLNKSNKVRPDSTFAALAIGNPNPSLEEEKARPSRPPPQEKAGSS
jgi:hypothetical protein